MERDGREGCERAPPSERFRVNEEEVNSLPCGAGAPRRRSACVGEECKPLGEGTRSSCPGPQEAGAGCYALKGLTAVLVCAKKVRVGRTRRQLGAAGSRPTALGTGTPAQGLQQLRSSAMGTGCAPYGGSVIVNECHKSGNVHRFPDTSLPFSAISAVKFPSQSCRPAVMYHGICSGIP